MSHLMLFVLLVSLVTLVLSSPVRNPQDAMLYLMNYKYLQQSDMNNVEGNAEDAMTQALKMFQSMANINQTGKIDNDTMRMMNMPRCGAPDMVGTGSRDVRKKRFTLSQLKWEYNDLTYRIDSRTPDLAAGLVDQIMADALKAWSDVSALTFTRVAAGQPADILISFHEGAHGDGNPFDGPGSVLAHAYFPNPNPIAGDAHFDDAEPYTDGIPQGINLFQVAAHEFGHSLGLGHSAIDAALMAPFYQGYVPNFELHPDDVAGIQAHYGPNVGNPDEADDQPDTPTGDCMPQISLTTQTGDGAFYIINATHAFRLEGNGPVAGYPKPIQTEFPGLPNNLDAGLYYPPSGQTFFFKGTQFWRYTNQAMDDGYPVDIATGFPGLPNDLDAAFIWSGNGRIYFIKDDAYYRFSPGGGTDPGYPRPLALWNGLPATVDGAMAYSNSRTYFFSGENYYRFNDDEFAVDTGYPRNTAVWWLGCDAMLLGAGNTTDTPRPGGGNNAAVFFVPSLVVVLTSMLISLL